MLSVESISKAGDAAPVREIKDVNEDLEVVIHLPLRFHQSSDNRRESLCRKRSQKISSRRRWRDESFAMSSEDSCDSSGGRLRRQGSDLKNSHRSRCSGDENAEMERSAGGSRASSRGGDLSRSGSARHRRLSRSSFEEDPGREKPSCPTGTASIITTTCASPSSSTTSTEASSPPDINSATTGNRRTTESASDGDDESQHASRAWDADIGAKCEKVHSGRWVRGEHIGKGSYGQVFKAMDTETGAEFAVKEIPITLSHMEGAQVEALSREIGILRGLSHCNIIRYLGFQVDRKERKIFIHQELCQGNSLSSRLATYGKFTNSMIRRYGRQLLAGLDYLHQNGVIHMDIKCDNILLDKGGIIKLCDFGTSASVYALEPGRRILGSPLFTAPEVILHKQYTTKADIWSLGCSLYQMASSLAGPFQALGFKTLIQLHNHMKTHQGPPPIPESLAPALKAFLLRCFAYNPEDRPTAAELLNDPFFKPSEAPVIDCTGAGGPMAADNSSSLLPWQALKQSILLDLNLPEAGSKDVLPRSESHPVLVHPKQSGNSLLHQQQQACHMSDTAACTRRRAKASSFGNVLHGQPVPHTYTSTPRQHTTHTSHRSLEPSSLGRHHSTSSHHRLQEPHSADYTGLEMLEGDTGSAGVHAPHGRLTLEPLITNTSISGTAGGHIHTVRPSSGNSHAHTHAHTTTDSSTSHTREQASATVEEEVHRYLRRGRSSQSMGGFVSPRTALASDEGKTTDCAVDSSSSNSGTSSNPEARELTHTTVLTPLNIPSTKRGDIETSDSCGTSPCPQRTTRSTRRLGVGVGSLIRKLHLKQSGESAESSVDSATDSATDSSASQNRFLRRFLRLRSSPPTLVEKVSSPTLVTKVSPPSALVVSSSERWTARAPNGAPMRLMRADSEIVR